MSTRSSATASASEATSDAVASGSSAAAWAARLTQREVVVAARAPACTSVP